jgi:hypothetical protein
MTDTKDLIEQLVYAYDLSTLNVDAILPDDVKRMTVTEQLLSENLPTLEQRSDLVAYAACFYAFLNEKPDATREEFNAIHDPEALEKVSVNVRTKLQEPLSVVGVIEFHAKNCSIPTRVDINRQVKS